MGLFLLTLGACLLLEVTVGRYLPWWAFMALPFAFSALMATTWQRALSAGAAAVGLLWLATAAYLNSLNAGILGLRLAPVFALPGSWALIVVSALIGALTGGLSALSGYLLKFALKGGSRR